jgi:hypothetical protein
MGKGSSTRPYSVSQTQFGNNYDRIFRKSETMSPSVEEMKKGTCGCGRSPTGNCCGWHALSEDQFAQRKELYETGKVDLAGNEVK